MFFLSKSFYFCWNAARNEDSLASLVYIFQKFCQLQGYRVKRKKSQQPMISDV